MSFNGLMLVDGSSYLYRAFHALPPLNNAQGQPTGAIFGVVNMLKRLLKDYQPKYCAVVFDAKGRTFRDDLYEHYKAHRPAMPDDMRVQVEPLHAIIRAMGLPLLAIEGVEADDVIGTLAKEAESKSLPVLISTGDKDMAQLVNPGVTLTNTMTGTTLDEAGVFAKFGVKPSQIIDYLTLVGDSSDNIPGVPGVGPKTAAKWLQQYPSLKDIVAHADQIMGKVGENLRASLHQFEWVEKLVTIHCDVPLPCHFDELAVGTPDKEKLIQLFTDLGFNSWLKELVVRSIAPKDNAPITEQEPIPLKSTFKCKYACILQQTEFDQLVERLKQCNIFAVDTETTSLNINEAKLVGLCFALDSDEGYYLPLTHDYMGAPAQLPLETCLAALKPILENEIITKIFQHAKYDLNILANYGIQVAGPLIDTQLQAYVLQSHERNDMDRLAERILHHHTIKYEDVAGKGVKQLTFNQVNLETAAPYAAEDAQVTFKLYEFFEPKLKAEPNLLNVFHDIEMPLVPILVKMEREGVLIDVEKLHIQSQELAKRILQLEEQAFELAGQAFNLGSPKQLQEILFGKLQLPVTQKTPTGQASTSEEVLQDLAYEYELPRVILQYRSLSKLKSTYTDRLPEQRDATTGRVHTSYHQAVVPTGRLSSSDPNLQNIPVRTEEGRRIRQAFIAPKGYKILAADYSQVELRIMAHLSQDPKLLAAFQQDEDIHQATASEVFGVPLEKVSVEERRHAKAINFGLMYGMSAFGLAKQLTSSRTAAQEYIDRYFARYPKIKEYMDRARHSAHEKGYVETLFGRRLYLPDITARQQFKVKAAERAAINGPLQGTAADIIKRAMIAIDQWIVTQQVPVRMVMQVHDELVFEVREDFIEQAKKHVSELMSGAADLDVKLEVGLGVGDNWDEAH